MSHGKARKPGEPGNSAHFLFKSGKSSGIFLENGKSHGKVMECIPWFLRFSPTVVDNLKAILAT